VKKQANDERGTQAARELSRLRLGTSSWSEKSWVGAFYPPGTKPADMLAFYATQFTTVEADNTYYRVPSASMVRGWRTKTPPGFTLSAKFPRSIVHAGAGEKPDGERVLVEGAVARDRDAFLEAMRELGDRAGPLVMQFPYFNRTAFATLDAFLERLDPFLAALPREFRYGVEVRNKNWVTQPLLECLRARNVAFVHVDLVYMPHPSEFSRDLDLVTSDFLYVRLIGDRQAVEARTETFDHIVIDHGERLDRWAEWISTLLPDVRETFAYANNHFAGYGPETIRDLARRIEKKLT
jgi:uncharacterized protein YecE (DUF72 family)